MSHKHTAAGSIPAPAIDITLKDPERFVSAEDSAQKTDGQTAGESPAHWSVSEAVSGCSHKALSLTSQVRILPDQLRLSSCQYDRRGEVQERDRSCSGWTAAVDVAGVGVNVINKP